MKWQISKVEPPSAVALKILVIKDGGEIGEGVLDLDTNAKENGFEGGVLDLVTTTVHSVFGWGVTDLEKTLEENISKVGEFELIKNIRGVISGRT